MKKIIFITTMALLVMVSCSKDEIKSVNQGRAMGFHPTMGKATRAAETTLANLNNFNVTAFKTGTANYFTDLAVNSPDAGVNWKTASIYYWPSFELNFTAYAPQDLKSKVTIDHTTQKLTDFSPEKEIINQKDVVIAFNKGTKVANEASGVPMNFKHALSQIKIQAKSSNANYKVEVLGVKISQIKSKSTFTFPQTETKPTYLLPKTNWSAPTDPAGYMSKLDAKIDLTSTAQSIMKDADGGMMLIPQKLVEWDGSTDATTGSYIAVLCRIYSLNSGVETLLYPVSGDKYGFSAVAIDTDWLPGKRYTYILEFFGEDGGAGQVDPDGTNPNNLSDPNVNSNPDPDKVGGDEILGQPIKFTVTVDDWVDATTEEIKMQ